jgi:enoyl-CoA hydratase/carnithine racemase
MTSSSPSSTQPAQPPGPPATHLSARPGADAAVLFDERSVAGGRRIGVITLNRPRQLNALNLEMCTLMLERLREWRSDTGLVAVLLAGAGDKGFCAGGDVADVVRKVRAGGDGRFVYGDSFFEVEYQLDLLIHTFGKPLIVFSHGVCMGGGLGLAAGASHRVVSDGSRIAMPEVHIGLFPDVGGGFFLNRVPGGAGRLMALTGATINEADALFAGLADGFVPLQARDAFIDALIALPWSGEPSADRERVSHLVLSELRRFQPALPESNLRMYFDAIRFICAMPTVTGLRDALQAAAAADRWFEPLADNLTKGSPTTAFVAFEYLRRCQQLSLREVLDLDLVLARNFQREHDFCEGVRALLIDKDRKPVWSPPRFEDVDPALVARHFVPMHG